jgi:glycerol-1-phosphate dehydrogenase [NAD(P)+]
MIAESAARPVLDLEDLGPAESREVVARGLLLSGLAMAAAGTSRPCSGAEHLVSHALDAQLGGGAALHGAQVALGCLVSAAAHGSPLLATLRRLFVRLRLPTCPADLGLTHRHLVAAVRAAPATRPERWTVLSQGYEDEASVAGLVETAFAAAPLATQRVPRRSTSQATTRSVA